MTEQEVKRKNLESHIAAAEATLEQLGKAREMAREALDASPETEELLAVFRLADFAWTNQSKKLASLRAQLDELGEAKPPLLSRLFGAAKQAVRAVGRFFAAAIRLAMTVLGVLKARLVEALHVVVVSILVMLALPMVLIFGKKRMKNWRQRITEKLGVSEQEIVEGSDVRDARKEFAESAARAAA